MPPEQLTLVEGVAEHVELSRFIGRAFSTRAHQNAQPVIRTGVSYQTLKCAKVKLFKVGSLLACYIIYTV